jgi:hypothetical protein
VRMPWGKHRGRRLEDVPVSYLAWCLNNCEGMDPRLRRSIEQILDDAEDLDDADEPPAPADALAPVRGVMRRWYGDLSKKYHPDRGGSVVAMQVVNDAYDRLRELTGV